MEGSQSELMRQGKGVKWGAEAEEGLCIMMHPSEVHKLTVCIYLHSGEGSFTKRIGKRKRVFWMMDAKSKVLFVTTYFVCWD